MELSRAVRSGLMVQAAPMVLRFAGSLQHPQENIITSWLTTAHAPSVVSHWSALVLAGVIPTHPQVHILVARSARGWAVPDGTVVHTALDFPPSYELKHYHGVPATRLTRSLLDIAQVTGYAEFTALVKWAIEQGYVEFTRLQRAAGHRGGNAHRFVRRFLRAGWRDYIRDVHRGRSFFVARGLAREEAESESLYALTKTVSFLSCGACRVLQQQQRAATGADPIRAGGTANRPECNLLGVRRCRVGGSDPSRSVWTEWNDGRENDPGR
jgi:hypothetical protein